jgi:hypothetical protein
MKNKYIYNTSGIGYMDEEWINYDPNKTDEVISEDENILKENEEKLKEV